MGLNCIYNENEPGIITPTLVRWRGLWYDRFIRGDRAVDVYRDDPEAFSRPIPVSVRYRTSQSNRETARTFFITHYRFATGLPTMPVALSRDNIKALRKEGLIE